MATGTVKFYRDDRGFGFIKPDDGGKDVFVHISECKPLYALTEGERVEFELGMSKKSQRVQAEKVKVLKPPPVTEDAGDGLDRFLNPGDDKAEAA
jgi:CspA family cold shock protein